MSGGHVQAIFVTPKRGGPTQQVPSVSALVGRGLDGDHRLLKEGATVNEDRPGREVTLIEAEAIEALDREAGLMIMQGEARRNIVTRGVALNELVDREFAVGEVVLRGIRLCHPCGHLERLTLPGVEAGLKNRGGLRAQIVRGGTIRTGDPVKTS